MGGLVGQQITRIRYSHDEEHDYCQSRTDQVHRTNCLSVEIDTFHSLPTAAPNTALSPSPRFSLKL